VLARAAFGVFGANCRVYPGRRGCACSHPDLDGGTALFASSAPCWVKALVDDGGQISIGSRRASQPWTLWLSFFVFC